MAKKVDFKFKVIGIEDFGFSIDEFIDLEEENVLIGYRLDLFFDIENDGLGLTINVFFDEEVPGKEKKNFMSGKIATRFEVENLGRYINNNGDLNFPKNAFETLFSVAYTHARAILAKNAGGSSYSSYIMPMINPKELLPQLIDYNNLVDKKTD